MTGKGREGPCEPPSPRSGRSASPYSRPHPPSATQKFGPLQLSGNLQSQNLIRTPDVSTYEFIQNRNTAHLRLEYDWLQSGQVLRQVRHPVHRALEPLPPLARRLRQHLRHHARLHREGGHPRRARTAAQNVFEFATEPERAEPRAERAARISGLTHEARDALKFDNQLREAYVDLKLRGIPLTIRAGRQQIVWGETDNFRMLDRVNPLDLTWHFVQEIPPPAFGWDEIRRPFWMLKFLYDLGDVWKLSQSFLEWYWNPGDWYPAKQAFLPRPWGLPLLEPAHQPGRRRVHRRRLRQRAVRRPNAAALHALMNGTQLFEQGDYDAQPDRQQPGRRPLPRHHALRARVHAQLLLPALGRRRRHELRAAPRPRRRTTPNTRARLQPAHPAGHLPGRVHRALRPHGRRLGELLRRGVHADRLPPRDDLRHRHPVLRRRQGDDHRHARSFPASPRRTCGRA